MDVQSNLRCLITKKSNISQPVEQLYSKILEESKLLETLNRKISKSSGKKIVNEISMFRKGRPWMVYNQDSFSSVEEKKTELKKPGMNIFSSVNVNKIRENFQKKKMFDVEFKEHVWPEESVIDDQMFQVLRYAEDKKVNDFKIGIRNVHIRSRVGELDKTGRRTAMKSSGRVKRKEKVRSFSPWDYNGGFRSILASPFV